MQFSWKNLKKPFFALAPMEGATDTVFRQIILSCGKPDVMFTEFTNVDGLLSKGKENVGRRLLYSKDEHPIIAQIWGNKPESFYEITKLVVQMGFDGIDINMGCPERSVVAHGSCAALIQDHNLTAEIIKATHKGAEGLPVSVKTRIGFKTIETEDWIGFLLSQELDALTVHFRTQAEMSLVPAHWEEAKKIVNLRDRLAPNTVIIGNGDVETKAQGMELAYEYGLNGIMIGRGAFHNPYVFSGLSYEKKTKEEKINLLKKHLDLFEQTWKKTHPISDHDFDKSYPPLKRHFKIYIQGFEDASELREKLMLTKNLEEARQVLI